MKHRIEIRFVFSLMLVFLTACAVKNTPTTNEITYENGSNIYPGPEENPNQESDSENNAPYPSINQRDGVEAYPAINSPARSGPKFDINEPVLAGSTQLTGTGPANVTIILVDVSEMGLLLSETTINSEGEFTFDLQSPLVESHAVGLQISDFSNTDYNYDDFIFGEDYIDRPLIGTLLDMASVVTK